MKKIIIVILVILVMGIGGIYMLNHNLDNGINNLTSEEEIILNRYKEMQQAMVDKDIDKLNNIEIKPAVTQVETHPYYPQTEMKERLSEYGTKIQAWYPLGGRGNDSVLTEDIIK